MDKETKTKPKRKPTGAAAMGAGPGRPKGSQNRQTVAIKDMILQALGDAGGIDYLVERAQDPRTASAFLGLVGKVLPTQVTGADGGPVKTVTRIEIVALTSDHGTNRDSA